MENKLLEKVLDTQEKWAKNLSHLNQSIDVLNSNISDIKDEFKNGFRSDLKGYISDLHEKTDTKITIVVQKMDKTLNTLAGILEAVRNPWFWIKLAAGFLISMAALAVAFMKILELLV